MLYLLRIELDAHVRGERPERPWVAEITGTCPRYGLRRAFVAPMKDWSNAHVSMRGRTYGVVATYALHEGRVYEVQRYMGRQRRRLSRSFAIVDGGMMRDRTLAQVLEVMS